MSKLLSKVSLDVTGVVTTIQIEKIESRDYGPFLFIFTFTMTEYDSTLIYSCLSSTYVKQFQKFLQFNKSSAHGGR
jgi:hypothetical protein